MKSRGEGGPPQANSVTELDLAASTSFQFSSGSMVPDTRSDRVTRGGWDRPSGDVMNVLDNWHDNRITWRQK